MSLTSATSFTSPPPSSYIPPPHPPVLHVLYVLCVPSVLCVLCVLGVSSSFGCFAPLLSRPLRPPCPLRPLSMLPSSSTPSRPHPLLHMTVAIRSAALLVYQRDSSIINSANAGVLLGNARAEIQIQEAYDNKYCSGDGTIHDILFLLYQVRALSAVPVSPLSGIL